MFTKKVIMFQPHADQMILFEVMVFTSTGHRVIFPREVEFMTNYYNLIPIHLS